MNGTQKARGEWSRRRFLAAAGKSTVAALLGPSLLAACSRGGGDSAETAKKVIGFDHPFNMIPFWTPIMAWAKKQAQARGYELLVSVDNGDLNTQVANLNNWVTQKVPAFISFPIEPTTIGNIFTKARQAGIKVVTYGVNMPDEDGAVLLNNTESGRLLGAAAAEWVNQTLGGEAKVVQLTFPDGGSVGRERDQAVLETFKQMAPRAQIVATEKAVDQEGGLKVMNAVLAAHPDVNVVLGINDDGALGAYQAFLNHGHAADDPKVWIGGQDGAEQALKLIKDGTMYRACSALRISELAAACVNHTIDVLEGKASGSILVPIKLLTAADGELIDQYLAELREA